MIGLSILSNLFNAIIGTGLYKSIYHSVIQRKDQKGHITPSAPIGDKFEYVGPDDSKGSYCYCRQVGSIDVLSEDKMGSCGQKEYKLQILHRLVLYNQNESRAHDDLFAKLMKVVMSMGSEIKFVKGITIVDQLAALESPTGKYQFGTDTFYCAIEFFVLLKLQADDCPTEIRCEGLNNPYCIM